MNCAVGRSITAWQEAIGLAILARAESTEAEESYANEYD